jgi:hypothetical protein
VTLSDREKKIAIGVGVAALAFVLYQFVLTPFLNDREAIANETTKVNDEITQANNLFARQRELKKVWREMTEGVNVPGSATKPGGNGQQGGGMLKLDEGDARVQATNAVVEWATDAGVRLTALKLEGAKKDGNFLVISFHATVTGSMRQLSKLTWALETGTIPLRVNDMRITPQKEGTDALQAEISISTLSMLAEADQPVSKPPVAQAVKGDRS